jgi:glycosyltransferase involved in cell wall biosynthesis
VVNAHNIHVDLSYYSLTFAHRMGIPTVFNSHDVMPFAYNRLRHFINLARCGVESVQDYRLPRFYNLREMRFRYNPFRNLVIRRILSQHTRARVAVSQAHRQALEANRLPPFRVVYNGIDPEGFRVSPAAVEKLRARLDLQGRRVILFAGRLTGDKGSLQMLQAMKRLVERVPEALLLVLSSRDFMLEEFTALEGTHVRAAGWLDGNELVAAYHLADIVTVPSIILDSFPTVNLEAMAAGKPLISTCFGGSPEIVVDGETGFVINPFDIESFAGKLELLLRDEDLRQKMGQAGHNRLLADFTLAKQVQQMVEIYKGVL